MKWFMDNITLQVDREGSIVYANNNDIFVIGGDGHSSRNTMEAIGEQGISSIENVNNVPTSTGSTIQTTRSSRSPTKKMECFQNGLPSPCTSTQKTTSGLTMSTSTTDTTIGDTKLVKLQQKFLYKNIIGISNLFSKNTLQCILLYSTWRRSDHYWRQELRD